MRERVIIAETRLTAWLRANIAWAFDPNTYLPQPNVVDLLEGPQGFALSSKPAQNRRFRRQVAVRLPEDMLLRKTLRFPIQIRGELDRAISVKLRQILPASGAGLVGRRTGMNVAGTEIIAEVAVARLAAIEASRRLCQNDVSRLHSVFCEGTAGRAIFNREDSTGRTVQSWAGISILVVALAVPTGNFILMQGIGALQSQTQIIQDQASELKARLGASTSRDDLGQPVLTSADDLSRFKADRAAFLVLGHLAELLPDTVWVSELLVQGDHVTTTLLTLADVVQVQSQLASDPKIRTLTLEGGVQLESASGLSRMTLSFLFVAEK